MNVKAEILTIKASLFEAETCLIDGDLKSAENFVLALQIYLNRTHHPQNYFTNKFQLFCNVN